MAHDGRVSGARDRFRSCKRRGPCLRHRHIDVASRLPYRASSPAQTPPRDRLVSRSIRAARTASCLVLLVATAIVWIPSHAAATVPALNGVIAGIAPRTYDLTLLNLRDGSRTILLKFGYEESQPAWAPSGDRLVVTEEGAGDLISLRPDGTGKKTLVDGLCGENGGTWSPDGTKVAYHTCDDISIVHADGTNPVHVPSTSNFGLGEWSPDGQWLIGAHWDGVDYDIWKIRPDGNDLTQLTDLPGDQLNPTVSPDGATVAFEDRQPSNWEIASVGVGGGAVTNLTHMAGKDFDPTWSPDGSRILFSSLRSGGDLFTIAPDGSGTQQVPNSHGMVNAAWQPAQVTLSASRQLVIAGATIHLDVRIPSPGSTDPSVTIQRRTTSTGWANWRTVNVDSFGKASLDTTVKEHTWYRAVWAGDASYLGGRSIQTLVRARVTVSGHLFRFYAVKSGWHLYHLGKRVWYTSDIVPNHAGKKMCFQAQRLRETGHWRPIFTDCYTIGKNGVTTIYIYNVPLGERARVRAVFRNDTDHLGDSAPWSRFRVTA
jgi:TolB protein